MQTWRLINCGEQDGAWNMALDEALLHSVESGESAPILRLYRWRPATVTLGYFQQGENVVNLEACRRFGYSVVRRITGGRAVLHDHEVTYAVIAPEQSDIFPGGVAQNYQVIASVLKATLTAFGIATTISSGRKQQSQADAVQRSACFTAPALSELVHDGRKMTGSAQKRLAQAFLQHGSIPIEVDLQRLFYALSCSDGDVERRVERLATQIGWMNRWLKQPVSIDAVETQLVRQFEQMLPIAFRADQSTRSETEHARRLLEQKYANPDWTLQGIRQPDGS